MGWQQELGRASAAFRDAEFHLGRAEQRLTEATAAIPEPDANATRQSELARRLVAAAGTLAPGFLGADLDTLTADTPLAGRPPAAGSGVRVGVAEPVPGARFPAVIPLLGNGHVVIDGDASDLRVAGLLQSMLLRALAAVPRLRVSLVDCVALGQTFTDCSPLIDAKIASPTATDTAGLEEVLSQAEAHVQKARSARSDGAGEIPYHLVMVAGLPPRPSRALTARIAALAYAGPHGRCHLVLAGWRDEPRSTEPLPAIENGTYITVAERPDAHRVGGIPAPVRFDPAPAPQLVERVYGELAERHRDETTVGMGALLPERHWTESSLTGLSTVVGRDARGEVSLSFDDATPHWMIGGRTGGGKTVFLLDVLYGLAARYGPRELALYLLDFKEGVSFTEFTPTPFDSSWIPHVRAVGVESDREYGVAVLAELRAELSRRATAMKRAGVTKLADLRAARPQEQLPRILAVIDEFHVLFSGNDRLAREAVAHLEELARKGRAYGVHMVLASQTVAGVEALYDKTDSIFGQFPMRVALPGARHILHHLNESADTLTLGETIVNTSGGINGADRLVRFPDVTAETTLLSQLRQELWQRRDPGSGPPAIFAGYAEQHLEADPVYRTLSTPARRPRALVGRTVDVDTSTVALTMDAVPGRHLAVLGTRSDGADVLHAAALSLARQHEPGEATFTLVPLVSQADAAADDCAAHLEAAGHLHHTVPPHELSDLFEELSTQNQPRHPRYVVVFGADTVAGLLGADDITRLRDVLKDGPGRGIHLLGWWRGFRRFTEDLGGTHNREDVACLVVLNVPGSEIGTFIGDFASEYQPRDNRALVVDRHENSRRLCVPFVRPLDEEAE